MPVANRSPLLPEEIIAWFHICHNGLRRDASSPATNRGLSARLSTIVKVPCALRNSPHEYSKPGLTAGCCPANHRAHQKSRSIEDASAVIAPEIQAAVAKAARCRAQSRQRLPTPVPAQLYPVPIPSAATLPRLKSVVLPCQPRPVNLTALILGTREIDNQNVMIQYAPLLRDTDVLSPVSITCGIPISRLMLFPCLRNTDVLLRFSANCCRPVPPL